jgi:hypothetical protein
VSFMRELHMAFLDYCSERTIRSATNQKLKSDEKRHRSSKSSKRNAVENDANIERSGCPFGRPSNSSNGAFGYCRNHLFFAK